LGHPCKFQRVSRLGSFTARHSGIRRQPNVSAGRPSLWALAHISSGKYNYGDGDDDDAI